MSSSLRHQISSSASTTPAVTSTRTYAQQPPAKKQKKMTVTQTYYLAHTARGKLSHEAARGDHDLRLLVGHANLLDNLMVELHDAEREQEAWFNQTIRSQRASEEEPQHVQWSDKMATVAEEDEYDSDDSDEELDVEEMLVPIRRLRSPPVQTSSADMDIDEDTYDEDMDGEFDDDFAKHDLALVRTSSHSSPPELVADSPSDSDEDEEPKSPPQPTLDANEIFASAELEESQRKLKEQQQQQQQQQQQSRQSKQQPIVTERSILDTSSENEFFLPEQQPLIAAAC